MFHLGHKRLYFYAHLNTYSKTDTLRILQKNPISDVFQNGHIAHFGIPNPKRCASLDYLKKNTNNPTTPAKVAWVSVGDIPSIEWVQHAQRNHVRDACDEDVRVSQQAPRITQPAMPC